MSYNTVFNICFFGVHLYDNKELKVNRLKLTESSKQELNVFIKPLKVQCCTCGNNSSVVCFWLACVGRGYLYHRKDIAPGAKIHPPACIIKFLKRDDYI